MGSRGSAGGGGGGGLAGRTNPPVDENGIPILPAGLGEGLTAGSTRFNVVRANGELVNQQVSARPLTDGRIRVEFLQTGVPVRSSIFRRSAADGRYRSGGQRLTIDTPTSLMIDFETNIINP